MQILKLILKAGWKCSVNAVMDIKVTVKFYLVFKLEDFGCLISLVELSLLGCWNSSRSGFLGWNREC